MVGETLLASFGFKLRSVVNFLISVYAMAVTSSFFGYGPSGIENVARGLDLLGLDSGSSELRSFYTTIRDLPEATHNFLALLFGLWLLLSCIFFTHTYNDEIPDSLNVAPNSVFGVTAFFGLCIDLFSPGCPWSRPLIPILLSIAWGSFHAATIAPRANKATNAFVLAFLMVFGLLCALFYAVISIPLWFAQGSSIDADSEKHPHN